jgi:hypothetical protein
MGDIDQAGAPERAHPIRLFQQGFEILSNEQILAPSHGLLSQKALKSIEQPVHRQRQGPSNPAIALIAEEHLQKMLNIQILMTPTTGHILPRQQKLPSIVTETIRF